jgi:hypothetical protein
MSKPLSNTCLPVGYQSPISGSGINSRRLKERPNRYTHGYSVYVYIERDGYPLSY